MPGMRLQFDLDIPGWKPHRRGRREDGDLLGTSDAQWCAGAPVGAMRLARAHHGKLPSVPMAVLSIFLQGPGGGDASAPSGRAGRYTWHAPCRNFGCRPFTLVMGALFASIGSPRHEPVYLFLHAGRGCSHRDRPAATLFYKLPNQQTSPRLDELADLKHWTHRDAVTTAHDCGTCASACTTPPRWHARRVCGCESLHWRVGTC